MMRKKGQASLEIVILIMTFVMAFTCMRNYLRCALRYHWKSYADNISQDQYSLVASSESNPRGGLPGALIFEDTRITTSWPGGSNLLDSGGEIKQIDGWGTYSQ